MKIKDRLTPVAEQLRSEKLRNARLQLGLRWVAALGMIAWVGYLFKLIEDL